MEPVIRTGSIVFVKKIDSKKIAKNNIIAFLSPSNPKVVILHRVVDVKSVNPLVLETKGDANKLPDNWLVKEPAVLGRYYLSIPYLGYVIAWIKNWLPIRPAFAQYSDEVTVGGLNVTMADYDESDCQVRYVGSKDKLKIKCHKQNQHGDR